MNDKVALLLPNPATSPRSPSPSLQSRWKAANTNRHVVRSRRLLGTAFPAVLDFASLATLYLFVNLSYIFLLRNGDLLSSDHQINRHFALLRRLLLISRIVASLQAWLIWRLSLCSYRGISTFCLVQTLTLVVWHVIDGPLVRNTVHDAYKTVIDVFIFVPMNTALASVLVCHQLRSSRSQLFRTPGWLRHCVLLQALATALTLTFALTIITGYRQEVVTRGFFDLETPVLARNPAGIFVPTCKWDVASPWLDMIAYPAASRAHHKPVDCLPYSHHSIHSLPFDTTGLGLDDGAKESHDGSRLRVITLHIDSLSRAMFHRQMPRTKAAIEAVIVNSPEAVHVRRSLYEFSRYHTSRSGLAKYSDALWVDSGETVIDSGWTKLSNDNSIWARVRDGMGSGIHKSHSAANEKSGNGEGYLRVLDWTSNAATQKCAEGKWREFHYLQEFIERYKDQPSLHLDVNFANTFNSHPESFDRQLATFLGGGSNAIDYSTTAVVLLSANGPQPSMIGKYFEHRQIEAANPFACLILPDTFALKHYGWAGQDRLRRSTAKLVTTHDFHATIKGFIRPSIGIAREEGQNGHGYDLLKDELPIRSCEEAGIEKSQCRCR